MYFKIAALVLLVSVVANGRDIEDGFFYLQMTNLPRKPCFVADCHFGNATGHAMECYLEWKESGVLRNESRYLRFKTAMDNPTVQKCGVLAGGRISVFYTKNVIKTVLKKGHNTPPEVECWTRERDMTKEIKAELDNFCKGPKMTYIDHQHCC